MRHPRLPIKLNTFACVILVLAFAVRVIGLGEKSFWYDEGYTVAFAQNNLARIIAGAAQLELNTPLHYLLLKLWVLGAGQSEFVVRLLSVFAGMLTVAAAGKCAGRRNNQMLAMLFVALSSVCIALSQETRMYSLLVCFCTLAVAQLLRCLHTNKPRAWVLWAAFNAAAFATHVLGAILFGAQVIAVLAVFLLRQHRPPIKPFLFITFITGLGMLAVLAWVVSVGQSYGTTYTGRLNFVITLMNTMAALALPRLQPEAWQTPATIVVTLLLLLVLAQPRPRLVGSITLISLLGIAALCAITGKFAARYAAIVAPLFLAALGDGLLGKPRFSFPQLAQTGFGLGIAACLALGAWQWRINPIYANENFRDAAQFIRANLKNDETVLLVSGHLAPVFAYYFGATGWHALPNDPVLNVRNTLSFDSAMPAINTALRDKQGAWLLLWQEDVIDPTHLTQALLRRQSNRLQPEPGTLQFTGLRLLHFRFNQPYRPLPEAMPPLTSKLEALGQSRGLLGSGCALLRQLRTGDALMEIFCFWQVEERNSLPYNTQISLRLFKPSGEMLTQSDQQLAPDGLPGTRFDKVITSIYFVPLPPDTPAGSYVLQAIPYTAEGEVSPRATTRVDIEPKGLEAS